MACMPTVVEAVPVEPLPHGILSGCIPIDHISSGERLHELNGVTWMGLGCAPVGVWEDQCLSCSEESDAEESPGPPAEKEFHRPEVERAHPITLYAAAECGAIGWSYEDAKKQAMTMLELGQQRALEEGFHRQTARRAIDLTPEDEEGEKTAIDIAQAVAVLEGALAEFFGGRGTLWVAAGAAAMLGCCNLIHRGKDGCLETLAGNRVVISAGASAVNEGPDGKPGDPGEVWLMITGPVAVTVGPVDVIPPKANQTVDRFNTRRVIVERTALVKTTCQPFMIKASVCPPC